MLASNSEPASYQPWPSGTAIPIAILPYRVDNLPDHVHLDFRKGWNNHGSFQSTVILLQGNTMQALLQQYDDDPETGITVLVDSLENVAVAESRVMNLFHLTPEEMPWLRLDARQSAHA